MTEEKKVKKAKPRASLAVAGRTGLDALMQIARDAPAAPSGAERLAKARADREEKVRAALTRDVVNVAYGLRQKGYGFALIANTITDVLGGVKITPKVIKSVLEQVAAQQQQRPQQAAPAPQQAAPAPQQAAPAPQQAARPAQPAQAPQQPRPLGPAPAGQPQR